MDRDPAGGTHFACAICSAPVTELRSASAQPFRCRSGHWLAIGELIYCERADDLDGLLYGVAQSLQESTRVVENLAYLYRKQTEQPGE